MSFRDGDLVTFDEDDKVLVLKSLVYEGNEYDYVVEVLADETDVTKNYKIMVAHYEDGTLEKVVDMELLAILFPMFAEMTKNDEE